MDREDDISKVLFLLARLLTKKNPCSYLEYLCLRAIKAFSVASSSLVRTTSLFVICQLLYSSITTLDYNVSVYDVSIPFLQHLHLRWERRHCLELSEHHHVWV